MFAGTECTFIAQASTTRGADRFTANSAVLAIRNQPYVQELITSWEAQQQRLQVCFGPGDQVALGATMLAHRLPVRHARSAGMAGRNHLRRDCEAALLAKSQPNIGNEWTQQFNGTRLIVTPLWWPDVQKVKRCYSERWRDAGVQMPLSRDGVCLLDVSQRLNPHDFEPSHLPADVFFFPPEGYRPMRGAGNPRACDAS